VWLALAAVLTLAPAVRADDPWYKIYEDGVRAYDKHQYTEAEQLLLKAMRQPLAPKDRGVSVNRYSQVNGVIPEYYLAMICSTAKRLDEAYLYAQTVTTTKDYFRRGDSKLKDMEDIMNAWAAANATRGITVTPPSPVTPAVLGPYYALAIGIDDYVEQPKLKTAIADAEAVAAMLQRDYGFTTTVLRNPTREQILRAFNDYRRKLTEKDNFLIYYAGHGVRKEKTAKVYWLPVDAEKDDSTKWIGASDITDIIQETEARHILLIADSCYAGGMTREGELELDAAKRDRANYLRKMIQFTSRSLLSSGGEKPVSDGGGDGHSVFARALLYQLSKPRDEAAFAAGALFADLKEAVAGRSGQIPDYTRIKDASLEVGDPGDFVFLRQPRTVKAPIH
jgi:hypothetical protein